VKRLNINLHLIAHQVEIERNRLTTQDSYLAFLSNHNHLIFEILLLLSSSLHSPFVVALVVGVLVGEVTEVVEIGV